MAETTQHSASFLLSLSLSLSATNQKWLETHSSSSPFLLLSFHSLSLAAYRRLLLTRSSTSPLHSNKPKPSSASTHKPLSPWINNKYNKFFLIPPLSRSSFMPGTPSTRPLIRTPKSQGGGRATPGCRRPSHYLFFYF